MKMLHQQQIKKQNKESTCKGMTAGTTFCVHIYTEGQTECEMKSM